MGRLLGRLGRLERAALGVLFLWLVWSAFASPLNGRLPTPTSPYFLSPLVLVAGVWLGRISTTRLRPEVVVAILVATTTLLFLAVVSTEGPAKAPTAYANANAALAVQVVGLCGLAILRADRLHRVVLWLTAAGAVSVIVANSSKAGLVVVVPVVATIALMAWRPARRAHWAVATGAVSMASSAAGVVYLAGKPVWPSALLTALDPARQTLWRDARSLWAAHPVTGAGPGSLADYSTLGADPDTAAAHSSVLQVGAETGWVGVILFSVLALAGLLFVLRGPAPRAAIGAAAWSALLVHSFTDHLLEFGPIMLAAGCVLGGASALSVGATPPDRSIAPSSGDPEPGARGAP